MGTALHAALAKQVIVHPRNDVYVEKARPTWSYRTAILQVGKADGDDSEYRSFLGFDLSGLAQSGARILSAKLRLHPLLASSNARLTHHACLLQDVTWRSDEVTWEAQPDAHCVDRSAPCCGGAVGSWQPRPYQAAEVELTYYVQRALAPGGDQRGYQSQCRRGARAGAAGSPHSSGCDTRAASASSIPLHVARNRRNSRFAAACSAARPARPSRLRSM